ncbi:DnaJ domain-containing protein [Tenacibaculum piscium]|uniref:DnaJ domain-containing protein n=1 Tax=Tenacibaculum piscium TaxID=1458515 RepID=UPI001F4365D4|nr:DnaJ domain-containing protein [Tenacibaculum piscium]
MKLKNYYKILNIKKDASSVQVKDSYRKLVKFWHPDINSNYNSHEKIIEINEAYEILNNIEKRKVYNRIYNEYFDNLDKVIFQENNYESRKNERYTNYNYDTKTLTDFENLQEWIRQAKKKADKLINSGLKKVDNSLETGFYAIGEIGNFFSTLFAILLIGSIGFNSIKYLFELILGTSDLSILALIFSIIGVLICIFGIINWFKEKLNEE